MALILIYTGDGKGKSSAGFGQLVRSLGHGARCKVGQFIKEAPEVLASGEYRVLRRLGVEWRNWGAGFTWVGDNDAKNRVLAQEGWETIKEWIEGRACDLILLDEFTYTLSLGYLDTEEVVRYLEARRQVDGFPHLVITGRNAPPALVAIADMVSSIEQVKHHLYDSGQKAQPMIEF
ncbi:MAG: cob(I)yrinic acid a,c-diamide adenosyltransferase [Sphaerochaeta sp.]|nr:cob(I)yrinic acid a,c-diamide adenosyltransferase [Sphaerochaeta sp.]